MICLKFVKYALLVLISSENVLNIHRFFEISYNESFTSNCKTQLMERDAFLPCRALFVLYFELGAWYCNAPLYSLSRHLSIVLS